MRGVLFLGTLAVGSAALAGGGTPGGRPEWALNATIIEACSCPMFCQCYFNTKPAAHGDASGAGHQHGGAPGVRHFCKANLAYKVNKGHYGDTSLDGARFWIANDLGDDFSDGEFEWAVLTLDRRLSPAQRRGLETIARQGLFPMKWKSFRTAEGTIDTWEATKDMAHATIDGGKTAEVKLRRLAGMNDEPVVIRNLRYPFGGARHEGFVLMPNEVEAWRSGTEAFEFRGTNGFMITIDINANDVAK